MKFWPRIVRTESEAKAMESEVVEKIEKVLSRAKNARDLEKTFAVEPDDGGDDERGE